MKKIICLLLCSFVGIANGAVIKNVAGINNLEWLDFSSTRDLTRNQVLNLISTDTIYSGYRYASINEVELLLNSYSGVSSLSNPSGWESAMGQDSAEFFAEFGLIEDYGTYLRTSFIFGVDGECGTGLNCGGFVHGNRDSNGLIYEGYYYSDYGWDVTNPIFTSTYDAVHFGGGWGSMLVKETTIPEPTSLALLGLGLAGFGFSRKKKKA